MSQERSLYMKKNTNKLINVISDLIFAVTAIGIALLSLTFGASQLDKGYIGDGIFFIVGSLYIVIVFQGVLIVCGIRYILNERDKNKEENGF